MDTPRWSTAWTDGDGVPWNRKVRDLPDAYRAVIEMIDRTHRPVDEEAERWPDDEMDPPVDEECTVTIQVCSECGYTYGDERVTFRLWPCPTWRAAHPEATDG